MSSAVITASPSGDSPYTQSLTVTTPELHTNITDVFELAHLRFGMFIADFVVPSAWRMFATN